MEDAQAELGLSDWRHAWNCSTIMKGYSGTAIFSRCGLHVWCSPCSAVHCGARETGCRDAQSPCCAAEPCWLDCLHLTCALARQRHVQCAAYAASVKRLAVQGGAAELAAWMQTTVSSTHGGAYRLAVVTNSPNQLLPCREPPLSVQHGLDIEDHDQEGRVITAEFPGFFVTTVYTPNSGVRSQAHALRLQHCLHAVCCLHLLRVVLDGGAWCLDLRRKHTVVCICPFEVHTGSNAKMLSINFVQARGCGGWRTGQSGGTRILPPLCGGCGSASRSSSPAT